GAHTAFAQMVAEAVNIPLDLVELDLGDTASAGDAGSASASRLTFMAGNAIIGAVEKAKTAWENEERPAVGEHIYRPPPTSMYDPTTGKSEPNFAYGYAAQSAEVIVDLETGVVEVLNVVCALDPGRVINPLGVTGQIEGAIAQAHGYTLLEHFKMRDGHVETPSFGTYLIPTSKDVPREVRSVIVENPDPLGPWGARGIGEMPFLPYAPAIVAAIFDATGVWFTELPIIPEKIVFKMRELGLGG
ncbi:MAG: xanthine dehydrogenase family protein molybdopterin-binding subunit, partial [Chloroflexi bacterium]|nr:xanthine dehydrogenase family protein molybdopterin-binding subunit [Chloroflexota bacterium]